MSHTYAPTQAYNLFKSVMIVFMLQALIVIVLFTTLIPAQIVGFLILVLNLLIAIALGWRLYKTYYHTVFTYDTESFSLKRGNKEPESFKWREFSKVSLYRADSGELSVRLYRNSEHFDLPASKLKLNPFDFRLEVMNLVSGSKGKK